MASEQLWSRALFHNCNLWTFLPRCTYDLADLFNRSLKIDRGLESKDQSKPFDEIIAGPESVARRVRAVRALPGPVPIVPR